MVSISVAELARTGKSIASIVCNDTTLMEIPSGVSPPVSKPLETALHFSPKSEYTCHSRCHGTAITWDLCPLDCVKIGLTEHLAAQYEYFTLKYKNKTTKDQEKKALQARNYPFFMSPLSIKYQRLRERKQGDNERKTGRELKSSLTSLSLLQL
ncbi:unnamed protein product [Eretmochelys imbricata]